MLGRSVKRDRSEQAQIDERLRQQLQDPTLGSQVHQAAELAAQQIREAISNGELQSTSTLFPRLPEFDDVSLGYCQDDKSTNSKVKAIRRGSRRGTRETNEKSKRRESGSRESGVQTSKTGTATTFSKSRKKMWPWRGSRKRESEAWVCGVCGHAFATFTTAERHERRHIQEVLIDLGYEVKIDDDDDDSIENEIRPPVPQDSLDSADSVSIHSPSPFEDLPPEVTLVPKPRIKRAKQRFVDCVEAAAGTDESRFMSSSSIQEYTVFADEALIQAVRSAEPYVLTPDGVDAEKELRLLARDKAYYDNVKAKAIARQKVPTERFRTDGEGFLSKVNNKFVDAYQIIKSADTDGPRTGLVSADQYKRKAKMRNDESGPLAEEISHSDSTLYVNVMVHNGVQVVKRELQRLAIKRWEENSTVDKNSMDRFSRFRKYAHSNMVKLAGMALASDFKPRRIAVQISNDLYRLLTPKLKRRGVLVECEIEYRVGPYFVLAVNVKEVDWKKLIKVSHRDLMRRRRRRDNELLVEEQGESSRLTSRLWEALSFLVSLTVDDMLQYTFSYMYLTHWMIYRPICHILYILFGSRIRKFMLSSVTDEIFSYAEEKGMEMEISACVASKQASFMLSALREIRADGKALSGRQKASGKDDTGSTIGPLLGPAIKADACEHSLPDSFILPENLEHVALEVDLPIGFRRLRRALLSDTSPFIKEVIYKTEAKYTEITLESWNKHSGTIGEPVTPDDVDENDFIGAMKEGSYLMPKSAFVAANTCYEEHHLIAYNENCFCLKKRARNPDVPFGKTFYAWTQFLVVNSGNNSCKLTCSVEAEFPNGEPMVARQIRSGMRAGTGELFVLIGETITRYAEAYPT